MRLRDAQTVLALLPELPSMNWRDRIGDKTAYDDQRTLSIAAARRAVWREMNFRE